MNTDILSRRDFLKLSGAGLLALYLTEFHLDKALAAPALMQGRVVCTSLIVRDAPGFYGVRIDTIPRDSILDIKAEVFGGADGDYNRIWYQLENETYVYSGWVQPVHTMVNNIVKEIPEFWEKFLFQLLIRIGQSTATRIRVRGCITEPRIGLKL
jgi:hypothetical protein